MAKAKFEKKSYGSRNSPDAIIVDDVDGDDNASVAESVPDTGTPSIVVDSTDNASDSPSIASNFGNLPVGLYEDGQLSKSYGLNEFDGAAELRLAEYKDRLKAGVSQGVFVTRLMAELVNHVGNHRFGDMSIQEREFVLNSMYMCDILHMYIHARMDSIGNDLRMGIVCPLIGCRSKTTILVDLATLASRVVQSVDDIQSTYELSRPISFKIGQDPLNISKVTVTIPRWSSISGVGTGSANAHSRQITVIQGCIVPGGGDLSNGMIFTHNMFASLRKLDIASMVDTIVRLTPGPVMVVDAECSRCRNEFMIPLEWQYDSFFSISSK